MARVFALFVILTVVGAQPVWAQQVEVLVPPLASVELAKLSPDLRSAVFGGARFVGISERGRAVLAAAPGADFTTLATRFADAGGVAGVAPERTIAVTEVVVIHHATAPASVDIAGLSPVYRSQTSRFIVLRAPDGLSPDILRRLANLPWATRIEPNYPYQLFAQFPTLRTPDDRDFAKQWGLKRIRAERGWTNITESKVIVAVLDTGLDIRHPELKASRWKNPSSAGTTCPGDAYGCDFTGAKPLGITSDPSGHGTAVAGIIGAMGNNTEGIAGVSWAVPIMGVRIFDSNNVWTGEHRVAEGIDYAVAHGARIINASWGGPVLGTLVDQALQRAFAKDVLVVAASGNSFAGLVGRDLDVYPLYPACLDSPNVIAVMASDQSDAAATFAHYGRRCVDLAAPGVDIYTLAAPSQYRSVNGTSFAAPFVSGAAALTWSLPGAGGTNPALIRQTLLDHARKVPGFATATVSGGVLDVSFLEVGSAALAQTLAIPGGRGTPPGGAGGRGGRSGAGSLIETQGEWVGIVSGGVMAIGGETTGLTLRTSDGTFELQANEGFRQQLALVNGQSVLVRGMLRQVSGIEIATRRIIRVLDVLRR